MTVDPRLAATPDPPFGRTVLWGVSAMASLLPLMMSMMLFDAPGSENNVWLWCVVGSMASFPLLCAISIVGSWISYAVSEQTHAGAMRVLGLLPLASPVLFGLSCAMLMLRCHGQFVCH